MSTSTMPYNQRTTLPPPPVPMRDANTAYLPTSHTTKIIHQHQHPQQQQHHHSSSNTNQLSASDSRTHSLSTTNVAPTPCQRLSEMFRRSIAGSSIQSDSRENTYEEIYPGPDPKQAIMGSLVFCIHHKQGCTWSDELRKLKGHLNVCKHDATQCPNKCGAQIPRIMMTDHLQYTCTMRRTKCEFCQSEFSGAGLEEHAGTCGQEPIYCEAKCGQRVLRGRMTLHKSKDCTKRLRRCLHCNREFSADTLALHVNQCPRAPTVCPQRCEIGPIARADLESHLRDECKALAIACSFKEAGCRFKGPRHMLEAHLEANAASHLSLMVALSARQGQQIQMLKSAVSKLSINFTGTLLWKITDWSAKMAEAKGKDGLELVSPPFYTSQYGYKLQASMFLNGNGPGENTHVSVYIKVLPGEYDALLKWPFSHSITFTLFEQGSQSGQGGVAESFVPDPTWENFQRPSNEPDQLGFGFPRFISHELLYKRPFIKDDTVFLRVKVDPSKIVAV
ncbi:TNF receptor-associated factor 4 isoform X1 [Stomoxys calcitrans]|uniref:TNF receptor-associated factor 4 isoform X1 n=1 Tax=Stomoxys calcitrans TaxID=35570 RepID=UPI0027E38DEB|nr:TNF receptor-associated factor 4 isoform X1 [Stomoxys calcitrans]